MVTGSKEPGDRFTEAQASARYLVAAGIPAGDILEAGGSDSWENLADAAPTLLARGDRTVLVVTDPFHEARSLAIASLGRPQSLPDPDPDLADQGDLRRSRTTPRRPSGWRSGRIIGFDHLDSIHSSLG